MNLTKMEGYISNILCDVVADKNPIVESYTKGIMETIKAEMEEMSVKLLAVDFEEETITLSLDHATMGGGFHAGNAWVDLSGIQG